MQAQRLERERKQRPRGFGRVAVPMMGGMRDEPDLALLVHLARPEQRDVAHELARRAKHCGGAQPLALGSKRRTRDLPLEQRHDLLARERLVVEPPRVQLVGVDLLERREVARLERTQDEPLGLERPGRREAHD